MKKLRSLFFILLFLSTAIACNLEKDTNLDSNPFHLHSFNDPEPSACQISPIVGSYFIRNDIPNFEEDRSCIVFKNQEHFNKHFGIAYLMEAIFEELDFENFHVAGILLNTSSFLHEINLVNQDNIINADGEAEVIFKVEKKEKITYLIREFTLIKIPKLKNHKFLSFREKGCTKKISILL